MNSFSSSPEKQRAELVRMEVSHLARESGGFQFLQKGEGNPILLFLHGLFGSLSNFIPLVEYFGNRGATACVPILPLYTMPLEEATVDGLVKYVRQFMDHMGFEEAILIGNSLGGHIALLMALKFPERVQALVLTGSSGLYERTLGSEYPRRNDRDFIREKAEMTFYDPAFVTDELVDEVYQIVNNRASAIRVISLSRSAMRSNLRADLPQIRQPVCLIWGRQDQITPPEVAEEFHQLLPDSELHFIDRCGHAPMMERPAEFIRRMEAFLVRRGFLPPAKSLNHDGGN